MSGYILYEGPSMLDGKPIVVIATLGTKNSKTGNMVQTWIMRSDVEPHTALKTGDDESVCGDCKHRDEGCYVLTFQAPLSVFRAYHRGSYVKLYPMQIARVFEGMDNRMGSYGDPAAAPEWVWREYTMYGASRTAYTHQWADPAAQWLKPYAMASVDTVAEYHAAQALGWRTFRVRLADEPLLPNEAGCPASKEAGYRKTCQECGACSGRDPRRVKQASISIINHGSRASRYIAIRQAA